ncbi:MAG: hypothetical protein RLZZ612_1423 [Pseudomonadota bacterium]|jgi:plasmid stability protein
MPALTIRHLDPALKTKLRMTAAAHGRSMEEEVRTILRQALMQPSPTNGLGSRLHARFAALGGVDMPEPDRTEPPRAAGFDVGTTT